MYKDLVNEEIRALEAELASLKSEEQFLSTVVAESKGACHVRNLKLMAKV